MRVRIQSSQIGGIITPPSSKSMMQRALAAALLSQGTSVILNPCRCDDTRAATNIIMNMGAKVEEHANEIIIHSQGVKKTQSLHCGESGLSLRMFSPIATLTSSRVEIMGEGSLLKRPVDNIKEGLKALGIKCTNPGNGLLPIVIEQGFSTNHAIIDGSLGSQFLTGLLMALPCRDENTFLEVTNLKSIPYIDMTLELLKDFGITIQHKQYKDFHIPGKQKYTPRSYTIEADWSSAAPLLVAGALKGMVRLNHLNPDSYQADKAIITALKKCGARVEWKNNCLEVHHNRLEAFEIDATHCPDLFPPLVALAVNCKGDSRIKGIHRLTHKESNRAETLKTEFAKLGVPIRFDNDEMIIPGGHLRGGLAHSRNDHRIAMALAVAGLASPYPVEILDHQCVAKSYPKFFDDLKKIGACVAQTYFKNQFV